MLSRRGFFGTTLAALVASRMRLPAPIPQAAVQPGLWRHADGRVFRYLRVSVACAVGDLVCEGPALVGVAVAALRAGEAGWVQVAVPSRVACRVDPSRPQTYRPGFVDVS